MIDNKKKPSTADTVLGCGFLVFTGAVAVLFLGWVFQGCFEESEVTKCHKDFVSAHKTLTGEWPGGDLSAKYLQHCLEVQSEN